MSSLKFFARKKTNYLFAPKRMLKRLFRKLLPNPLDSLLKKAARQGKKTFLIGWNRGLGDIPLGMYATLYRIKSFIPDAKVTFITRPDLCEGFQMLPGVEVLCCASWKRKHPCFLETSLLELGRNSREWDVVIAQPDPTYWVKWQLGHLTPKLFWDPSWDDLVSAFPCTGDEKYIGVHVQTETSYGYEKNWPLENFAALFKKLEECERKIILFGFGNTPEFPSSNIIDLRGKTTMRQMLSLIKNCCSHLLVPDSGVLSLTYFIDQSFPITIVSLWADPLQGVLKQNVVSPNPVLIHHPLIAKKGDLKNVSVEQVLEYIIPKKQSAI